MTGQLNRQNRLRIVPPMKKTLLALVLFTLAAPVFAQTSEFGFLFGGAKRLRGSADWASDGVKELYFGFQLEPGTMFVLKGGQIDAPGTFTINHDDGTQTVQTLGKVTHIDGLVNYKFSESFGSTGMFAGVGLYRQETDGVDETNYGVSAGINADFPLSRRYGIVFQGTYHWVNFDRRERFITATGGLRISF